MSIVEVSKAAGVSIATVSRVINRHPQVSAETIELVRAAIVKVGYTPPAREKRIGRPRRYRQGDGAAFAEPRVGVGSVAVLFQDTRQAALSTRLSQRLLRGIEEALWRKSISMTFTRLSENGELPPAFSPRSIDGAIVRTAFDTDAADSFKQFPIVHLFENNAIWPVGDAVLEDNAAIGRLAASQLIARGCKNLAYLNGMPRHASFITREHFFCIEARRRGVAVRSFVGEAPMAELIARMKADAGAGAGMHDGIFLPGTDGMAVEALNELIPPEPKAVDGREPEEIGRSPAIIYCHNDLPVVQSQWRGVSVIDICPEALGEAAVETLLWRLANPHAARRRVMIEPIFIKSRDAE
jgi:DNA-binding LacI/PurR family transcriptional regulator